jgi:DNA-binding MarR family transcriptional regulator
MTIVDQADDLGSDYSNIASSWGFLHMMVSRYGNHPMGQILVALTLNVFHRNGHNPTVDELCRATGIPKSTVSRYVSWQLGHGFLEEQIDPSDRRHRKLIQTEKAKEAMQMLMARLNNISDDVSKVAGLAAGPAGADPKGILQRMEALTMAAKKD